MVITELEARVPADRWDLLRQASRDLMTRSLPRQMVRTVILQSTKEATLWRVISTWKSREALDEYRSSVKTPGGVLLFRGVGAEPVLTVFEVAGHAPAEGQRDQP